MASKLSNTSTSDVSASWKFVATGNQNAVLKAIKGDPVGALADLDTIRDAGIAMEVSNPDLQNEIECRRLEGKFQIAGATNDIELLWKTMREMGQSNRFSAPRLHEMMAVAAGILRQIAGRAPQ
jgi:hypothetical protein